jgi:hypothetical protein
MSRQRAQSTAYAFCLDAVLDRHVYYRTVSLFSGSFGNHGRDKRDAQPVIIANFERIMELLELPLHWVRNEEDAKKWRAADGWALIASDYAEPYLGALLGSRECVKSAVGLFWDVALPRNRATSRRIPQQIRQRVMERDGHRCIECGQAETDGPVLTMDHVIPFSRGGETAEGNLVVLCETCNQWHGNAHHPHLFALARLHHGWDHQLLRDGLTSDSDAKMFAMMLSQNIMVSRCKTKDLPMVEHGNPEATA